jgi:N-formylglutamate deformylase
MSGLKANNPPVFLLQQGNAPLLVSIPHAGTYLPECLRARLTPVGLGVIDTDWHVDKLYEFLGGLDVTVITATHSRTAADLNRSPTGGLLYPGQAETGLCPTETFAGAPLYNGEPPDASDIAQRIECYWRPYHAELQSQIARLRALHPTITILDAHSIRGQIPRLFEGLLPDLNFGTNNGASCDPALAARAARAAESDFSQVLNGRFKGGYITRHYGNPADGINVIQLELAQRSYLDEDAPHRYDAPKAAALIEVLQKIVAALLN